MSDSSAKRIFISYKHNVEPDQSVVDRVVGALELQRHIVFIDKKILPGDEWGQWIQERITESDFLITFLTAQSVLSQMVQEEVQLARELAQSQGRPKVIPVRLAYDEELPYPLGEYLNHIQWAEWESEADTQRLITQLTQAVSGQSFASGQSQPKEASAQSGQPDAVPPPTPSAQPRSLDPTKLDSPEGTIDPQSAFYVVRSSDSVALDAIQRQGVTITIKGPRQMGKSSLLIRTLEKAVEKKKRAVFLDYQLIERDTLTDADRFYRRFCDWVTDELEMENRVDEFWNSPLGNSQRCTRYFSRYLLKEVLSWVMKWTNGHPYLTQRLCIPLSDQSHNSWAESDIDRVVADTFFGAMSEQDNNLQFVRDMLTKRALDINDVLTVYREIWRARKPVRDEEQSLTKSHLKLSGIVRRENGLLCLRNSIYKTVFD
ncbi:MAG: AAA-like domain-containing protein, partial [Blastocatellia bacterium]